ncbi:MAG: nucleotidyltransferase family protein [Deltaproteobacteria bacterium HGW-Deltaproteobacteria-9]|nr:MAG: nucleotidyltransferase family protein [Deltaproteobacteria bacterium HGW-Deltaproteobacteria-9]
MIKSKDIAALILCAGRSARMGDFKPLLPLGRDNFIERVISLYRSVGIENIVVVCGHEAQRVIPELTRLGVKWVLNEHYDKGMFSSIQTGVNHLHGQDRAFFLHPADIPFVRPDTLQSLIAAFSTGEMDICRPCYQGKHGHPPLISLSLAAVIREFAEAGGMRTLLARYAEKSRDVQCNDSGILLDIDTPEDYEKALKNISPTHLFNS